jgi:hypothetical protein
MAKVRQLQKWVEERPRYREAYPQFDIVQAQAAMRRGLSICEFTDRWDDPKGVARLTLGNNCCQLDYDFRLPHVGAGKGWQGFDLTHTVNGYVKDRALLICPKCETKKKIVFFKDTWACASCLQLSFRSQLIHPLSKKWEKFDELVGIVKNGKPHGMHNETYDKILVKLEKLEAKLYGKSRRYASDKYSEIVKCTWRDPQLSDHFSLDSITHTVELDPVGKKEVITPAVPLLGPVDLTSDTKQPVPGGYETSETEDM